MRLVFFSFKYRYRQKELNNFLRSRFYGKYFVLNLGGPLKHFIARLLIFLNIGKAISCDGRPLISKKSKGVNFWMRGTTLNIGDQERQMNDGAGYCSMLIFPSAFLPLMAMRTICCNLQPTPMVHHQRYGAGTPGGPTRRGLPFY